MKLAVGCLTVLVAMVFGVDAVSKCAECFDYRCEGVRATECLLGKGDVCLALLIYNGAETRLCYKEAEARARCERAARDKHFQNEKGYCYYCDWDGCNKGDPPRGSYFIIDNRDLSS